MNQQTEQQQVAILGSTGSVGKNTINVIEQNKSSYNVQILAAKGSNCQLIAEQCNKLKPKYVFIEDKAIITYLQQRLENSENSNTKVLHLSNLASIVEDINIDITISAISGFAGTLPTLIMSRCSKRIAIANKEAIICAWSILQESAKAHKCKIIPIDSEHNSIYQILSGFSNKEVQNITLTASGGPFINYKNNLSNVTPEMALKHPKWNMGMKNSIDSATLVNKGLEVIEACSIFDLPENKIKTVIHPQAIVHGLVSWEDNTTFAFLSNPDMKIHIANAMTKDKTCHTSVNSINLCDIGRLDFMPIDDTRFPSVKLARQAINSGPCSIVTYNAANEIAVRMFINGSISFTDIFRLIEDALNKTQSEYFVSMESISVFHQEVTNNVKREALCLG